jgi:hypothetical protein
MIGNPFPPQLWRAAEGETQRKGGEEEIREMPGVGAGDGLRLGILRLSNPKSPYVTLCL